MTSPVIGFAGLTHLGLVSGLAAAARGFQVVGYDADSSRVGDIQEGRLPVIEPGLDDLARTYAANITYSDRLAALKTCDIVYISTDVPTDGGGQSDLSGINRLIEEVLSVLGPSALLVILCQVPPGFTRGVPLPAERLYYQVETLIFGRAVERATQPERYIVGCSAPNRPLPASYAALLGAYSCPILSMRYESAELAKIAINCCLVASVTVANTLAELSEGIGADWSEIIPALRLDRRIGAHSYLVPGLGIAGGNLERDLATVLRLSEKVGSDASLIASFLHNSRHRRDWALRVLHREVLGNAAEVTLGVWGMAYKENTHSIKNSPSLELISHLHAWPIKVYDPVVPVEAAKPHPRIVGATSSLDAARGATALAIMTPWPEFRAVPPSAIAAVMSGRVVVDPYRVLDHVAAQAAGLKHYTLGTSTPAALESGG